MQKSSSGKGIFETGSGFYYYTGKIFDLIAVSIFWILGCIPVVTIGASCAALYGAVSGSVKQDIGTVSTKFWNSYKRNLKASIPLWMIFSGAVFLLLLNYGIVRERLYGLLGLFGQMLYLFSALLMIGAAGYAFPALSRFDMPLGWILKLSFYLTFRHLPRTMLIILLTGGSYVLLLLNPAVILVLPGLYGLLMSMLLDSVLEEHMTHTI